VDAAADNTVTLALGAVELTCRALDSSDACREASIALMEMQLHTEWIARVRERFFVDSPGRRQRLELAGDRVGAILLQHCRTDDAPALQAACEAVGRVFESLMPGTDADLPEVPNERVFERLARVCELRRLALGKLLRCLRTDTPQDPAEADRQIAAALDAARDTDAADRILDALLGNSPQEAPEA